MNTCPLCVSTLSGVKPLTEDISAISTFNERIVPIYEEPCHRHVLHSESVRVFDVAFLPNEVSLYHSHEKDSVMICLDGADVTNEIPGREVVPRPPIPSGEIYYRPYATKPFVHRVRNQGTTPFRILDIEILKAMSTVIHMPSLPNVFVTVLENERVRVSKVRLVPSQSTGELNFVGPRLLVITEAGEISVSSETGTRSIKADRGFLDIQETAQAETITNIGHTDTELVVLEIK